MNKPTNYQLLKDVLDVVNRMEDKIDEKIQLMDERVNNVEEKTDNMMGKIGIGILVISSVISTIVISIYNYIKNKLT